MAIKENEHAYGKLWKKTNHRPQSKKGNPQKAKNLQTQKKKEKTAQKNIIVVQHWSCQYKETLNACQLEYVIDTKRYLIGKPQTATFDPVE